MECEANNEIKPEVIGQISNGDVAEEGKQEVWSGHSWFRKIRFTSSLIGPMGGSTALSFARDIFVLQLGADPTSMGVALIVMSFWQPLCSPLAGYVMDKELLRCWFKTEYWGRRAHWFLLHVLLLTLSTGFCYLPPSQDPQALVAWVFFISFVGGWAQAVTFVAFESARAEIYPLKEERLLVESFTKVSCGVGSGASTLAMTFILSDASLPVRLATSLGIGLITLFSAQAVPIFLDARRPADYHLVHSLQSEVWSLLRQKALQHYIWCAFWQGAAEATIVNFGLYHLTYVGALMGTERQQWVFMLGALLVCVEAVTLPIFTLAFRSTSVDMQAVCVVFMAFFSVACPVVLRLMASVPRLGLLTYAALIRLAFSPQTFFKTASFCWIIDEDCLDGGGKRREATISGLTNLIGNFGRAVASSFLFLGFSQAGLVANNCTLECESNSSGLPRDNCVATCEALNIRSQPQAVTDYIFAMFYYVVPVCMFLSSVHTLLFPIRGERLRRLTQRQVEACSSPRGPSSPVPSPEHAPAPAPVVVTSAREIII